MADTFDSTNANVAVSGHVSYGPTATAGPTDASTALPVAWLGVGYISDDGVEETRDRSTNKIKAWQNAATVREVVTEASATYKFTMIETKKETIELYFGTSLDATSGSIVVDPAATGGRRSFVIDVIDGTDLIRTYVPSGEVTDVESIKNTSGDVIGYGVTVTAYAGTYGTGTPWTGAAKKFYSALKTP